MRRWSVPIVLAAISLAGAASSPAQPPIPVFYPPTEIGQVQTRCFYICFGQNCNGSGQVQEIEVAAPYFVRGIRLASPGPGNPCTPSQTLGMANRTLPLNVPAGQALAFSIDVVPTSDGHFKRPLAVNGEQHFELVTDVDPLFDCFPDGNSLCLENDRFKVRTFRRAFNGDAAPGGTAPYATDDSGLFWFFDQDNLEQLIKVLNACTFNQRYWVFAASTTNVEYTLTVTDTETQTVKTYFNPMGTPAPAITDTSAFATCP